MEGRTPGILLMSNLSLRRVRTPMYATRKETASADEFSMQPGAVRVANSRELQRLRQEMGELLE